MIVTRDDIRPDGAFSERRILGYECAECGWPILLQHWVEGETWEVSCGLDRTHEKIRRKPYQPPVSIMHENALEMRRRNKERWEEE